MTRPKALVAAAPLALALTVIPSRVPAAPQDTACREQAEKLCPGMKPGDENFGPCIKQHEAQFPKGCRRQLGSASARARDLKQFPSCVADADKFCPKGGSVMKCLRVHQTDLSEDCKREIGKRTGKY